MSVYSQLAECLQFISPEFYKKRFFKKLAGLDESNIMSRKLEPEMLWLKNSVSKDSVFFDIGTNVGAFIYLLDSILPPENIYAFEPNSKLNKRLNRLFPKANISDIALSDENLTASFKVPILNGQVVHTRGTLQADLKEIGETECKVQNVKVMKLDDWMEDKDIQRIDFMKIDVEGNEHKTLLGARKTISKFKPVLMVEIEQRHHQFPIWKIIEDVCGLGYEPFYLNRKTLELDTLSKDFLEAQNSENVKNYSEYINNIIFKPKL